MIRPDKVDVSVIIPYAEDWPHLYFTASQAAALLTASKLTHEIIICGNNDKNSQGQAIQDAAIFVTSRDLGDAHNVRMLVNDVPGNGPAANMAAKEAVGKYLCFTDSHVVFHPNIFTECIKVIDRYEDAGLVHSPITWTGVPHNADFSFDNRKRCFQYLYRQFDKTGEWYLHKHFHGTYNHHCVNPNEAYPVAGCGHGFFMVRGDTWKKTGGYHPAQRGYGGREAFVTFKMWLMGYRNFTVPTTNHMHYNGRRLYNWNMDWWYKNNMMQAYLIGGDKWLRIIYDNFRANPRVKPAVIERLMQEGVAESQEQRKFVVDNQKVEFDELFAIWDRDKVFY